jgi:hypothetical protein
VEAIGATVGYVEANVNLGVCMYFSHNDNGLIIPQI